MRISRNSWWVLGVLTTIYAYSWLDRQVIVMLVDPIKHELGLDDLAMSLVLGPAFGLCYVLFGIPLGWAADRYDRRWTIFFGVLIWSIATTATGFASSLTALFAMRLMVAVGEAALTPAAHSLLADNFPRNRLNTAMAVYSASPKVGISAAYALGGLLIAALVSREISLGAFWGDLTPWRQVFILVGIPGPILALLVLTFKEPARQAEAESNRFGFFSYMWLHRGLFMPLLFGFCAVSIPSVALQAWVPTYMGRQFGWSPEHYGPLIGLISGVSAFAVVLKGGVVDWLYNRGINDAPLRFYTWLLVVFTPVAAVAFLLSDPVAFLILYGLVQIVAIPYGLYMATSVQMVTPRAFRARASAATLLAGNLVSMTFGPTIVAFLTDIVFKDPGKLGSSLAVVTVCGMGTALLLLRYSLPKYGAMLKSFDGDPKAEQSDMSVEGRHVAKA